MIETMFDINAIVNFLFIGAVTWIRSLEVRLRHIPAQTIVTVESYHNKMSHRIDRLEDRMDKVITSTEENLRALNKSQ